MPQNKSQQTASFQPQPQLPEKKPCCRLHWLVLILVAAVALGVSIYIILTGNVAIPSPQDMLWPEKKTDEIADWQVYRNEEYGFEVKYPDFYFLRDDFPERKVVWFFDKNSAELSIPGAIVEVEKKDVESLVQELKNEDPGITRVVEEKDVVINNQPAKKLVLTTALGLDNLHFILSKNNFTYLLVCQERINNQVKILSTFKFLE